MVRAFQIWMGIAGTCFSGVSKSMIAPILRAAAKAVIQAEGGILALHPSEIDLNRKWHIPGGIRDDHSEPILLTALREVQEETGINLQNISPRVCKVGEWHAIDHDEEVKILAVFFHFVLPQRPEIALSEEHDGFAWLDRANYKSYTANPEVYEIVEELLN